MICVDEHFGSSRGPRCMDSQMDVIRVRKGNPQDDRNLLIHSYSFEKRRLDRDLIFLKWKRWNFDGYLFDRAYYVAFKVPCRFVNFVLLVREGTIMRIIKSMRRCPAIRGFKVCQSLSGHFSLDSESGGNTMYINRIIEEKGWKQRSIASTITRIDGNPRKHYISEN